jgi:hypothetical protein
MGGRLCTAGILPARDLQHGAECIASIYQFRSCHIPRLIEQHVRAFEESHRMRQFGMRLECSFVHPTGMNVKEPPVSHGTRQMKVQTSLFSDLRKCPCAYVPLVPSKFSD